MVVPNASSFLENSLSHQEEEPHDIHKDYPVEAVRTVSGFMDTFIIKEVVIPGFETMKNFIIWLDGEDK